MILDFLSFRLQRQPFGEYTSFDRATLEAPTWVDKVNSLEGEGAAVQLLGSAKTSLLGWGAAQQQELMGGVHKF